MVQNLVIVQKGLHVRVSSFFFFNLCTFIRKTDQILKDKLRQNQKLLIKFFFFNFFHFESN